MIPSLFSSSRRALLLVALSLGGLVLTLRADRSSEARANRLHRAGQLSEAAAIYDGRLVEDSTTARLRYNLGSTLLRVGSPAAFEQLTEGSETDDERLRVRALYNLGLWSLIQALMAPTNDSIFFHARNAVDANKAALRLDPEHLDARWNLSLAQQILVTAVPEEGPGDLEALDGPTDLGERQLANEPQNLIQEDGLEQVILRGQEEALAAEDLEALSAAEAAEILGTGHLNPSTIIAKLLTREGRARRRRRIFVTGPAW